VTTQPSDGASEQPIPRVAAGVFFGAGVSLPRGPQALPRSDVLAAQRERLMAAITELIAAGGYGRVTIGALASRAKVSRTAFYECFPSKEACAFAAYERFIEVFVGTMGELAAKATDIDGLISALLDGYFSTLERDPVAARAFLVEFDALGPQARAQRRLALRGIATYLRTTHEDFQASDAQLVAPFAEDVYLGILYLVRQLACDALDEQHRSNLMSIGDTLAPWLLTAFRPGASASCAARRVELERARAARSRSA
jgi:AcrR family transcriptional regulator